MFYFFIFLSKVIEISLATLRMIVVSNGKKWLGAILQLIHALIWIFSTGAVLNGIQKDFFNIIAFLLGSFVGSYIGSFIEEKLAIGNNMITCILDPNEKIVDDIRNIGYAVTVVQGQGMESKKDILLIMTTRKKRRNVVEFIQKNDQKSMIISENATPICGGSMPP